LILPDSRTYRRSPLSPSLKSVSPRRRVVCVIMARSSSCSSGLMPSKSGILEMMLSSTKVLLNVVDGA